MPAPAPKELQQLLASFIEAVEEHRDDPAFERARLEAIWLRDELKASRLSLPLRSTQDLYLCYAVSEGLFETQPEIDCLAEQIVDAVLGEPPDDT